jgi:hypothetical protein
MTRLSSRPLGIVAFESVPPGNPGDDSNEPRGDSPGGVLCRMRRSQGLPPSETAAPPCAATATGREAGEFLDADLRQLRHDLNAEVGRLTGEVYGLGKSFRPR